MRCALLVLLPLLSAAAVLRAQAGGDAGDAAPEGWEVCSRRAFERLVLPPTERAWSEEALADFAEALDAMDGTSVRAAVLLDRDPGPAATAALLARLEQRALGPERPSDSGDVAAAAALANRPADDRRVAALVALVAGERPHPDLDVRVECARTALALGADPATVAPFLLTVLRAGTPAERAHPIDWEPTPNLAWAKSRAAEALSDAAGLPRAFRADASFARQAEETARLERALGLGDRGHGGAR